MWRKFAPLLAPRQRHRADWVKDSKEDKKIRSNINSRTHWEFTKTRDPSGNPLWDKLLALDSTILSQILAHWPSTLCCIDSFLYRPWSNSPLRLKLWLPFVLDPRPMVFRFVPPIVMGLRSVPESKSKKERAMSRLRSKVKERLSSQAIGCISTLTTNFLWTFLFSC